MSDVSRSPRARRWLAAAVIAWAGCASPDAAPPERSAAITAPDDEESEAAPAQEPEPAPAQEPVPAPATSGAGTAAAPPTEPGPCDALPRRNDPPLSLVLERTAPDRIRAVFCNTSATLQRVLAPGGCGQRVMIELEHESEGPLGRYDGMSVRGCAGTVYSRSFHPLRPGEHWEAEVGVLRPTEDGAAYRLDFGRLAFQRLPPGRVTVRGHFVSRTDHSDDAGGIDRVWLGRLEAAPLSMEVEAP